MEQEDGLASQGEHFLRFLHEAEAEHGGSSSALWPRLLSALRAAGPPLPRELRAALLPDEAEEAGVQRLHHELGGRQGDCPEQQLQLTAASRYLGSRIRLARAAAALLEAAESDATNDRPPTQQQQPSSPPPPRRPAPAFLGGGIGGRGALLAALRGRGGGRIGGRLDGGSGRMGRAAEEQQDGGDAALDLEKLKVRATPAMD